MNRVVPLFFAALGLFGAGVWMGWRSPTLVSARSAAPVATIQPAAVSASALRQQGTPPPATARDWRRRLAELEPAEVPALLAAAQNIPDTRQRAFVLSRLLGLWAEEDPAAALDRAKQSPDLRQLDLRGLFRTWAERDPAAAAAHRQLRTDQFGAHEAAAEIAAAWCTRDLAAAVAWVRDLKDLGVRSTAYDAILRRLAQTDPAQAVALAVSLDQPANSDIRLWSIAKIQAAGDPAAALATINNLPPTVPRGPLLYGVVETLLREDPKLAGDFALTIPAGPYQIDALRSVARRLLEESPQSALDWLSTKLPAGPTRSTLFRDTLMSFASTDPAAAVSYLDQVAGNTRVNVALNLASNWARLDPQSAAAWAAKLPADQNRTSILRSLVRSWAAGKPAAALEFALRQADPKEQAATIQAVGQSWPASSTADLHTTLGRLPSDDARKSFLDGMLSGLGRTQPQAAAELVASLPAGTVHDSAARAYIANAAYADLALASRVANSIADNSVRQDALTSIARIWLTKDRAATTAWLATTDLPEATKQQLLAPGP